MSIIGVTGHRPEKLNLSYSETDHLLLTDSLSILFNSLNICDSNTKFITGMALGFDMAVAEYCVRTRISFIAAVPFDGQDAKWPIEARKRYERLLSEAESIKIVCEGGFASWKFIRRNEWIVNSSDEIICLWDGQKGGGTAQCVEYAENKGKKVTNLWGGFASL